jgi:hypothetical protein
VLSPKSRHDDDESRDDGDDVTSTDASIEDFMLFILCNYRVSFVCLTVLTKMEIRDAHD